MTKKSLILAMILTLLLSSCNNPLTAPQAPAETANASTQKVFILTPTITPTPAPQTRVVNGETEFYAGDYDSALTDLTAAQSSTDPEVIAAAMLFIGRIYLQEQNYQKAVVTLANLVNTQPAGDSRNTGFFFLAQSYEGLQQYQLAADAYQNYLKLNDSSPLKSDILVMQGDDLTSAGNNTAALAAYQAALPLAQPEYVDEVSLKLAQATATNGDVATAIKLYTDLYNSTTNNYTKATDNLLLGRLYLQEGEADQAYARFQDSVAQFPSSYDTYSGLIALVNANQPVDDLLRGIVDYNAGQYGLAISAFDRYIVANPNHDATVNYYKANSYYNMGDYTNEVAEWDKLIQNFPNDPTYYADAFYEKALTQWHHLQHYSDAAQTLLAFVAQSPDSSEAPTYLFTAGEIYADGNLLDSAAKTWERVITEYPAYENAILAEFHAGICYYRLGNYAQAEVTFQKNDLLTSDVSEKARAELWLGKTLQQLNQKDTALNTFKQAASQDPTGYYSIRADELANGQAPFTPSTSIDLGVDLTKEKNDAVNWMRSEFNLPADVDLLNPGDLANNILYQRGDAFWKLGMTVQAQSEFYSLSQQLTTDAANSFRLMNHLLDLGINQTAIECARQILDIVGLGDTSLMSQTPAYFNHVRFGVFYRQIIMPAASENQLDPMVVFSLIRQESLFEPEITSSQGATGLMQIIPSVGQEIVSDYGWPPDYIDQDLSRPLVNVKLGTHYLAKWDTYFKGNLTAALAAYNGGIGNAMNWNTQANNDPDLLLEVIPYNYSETSDYIRYVSEDFEIYNNLYSRK